MAPQVSTPQSLVHQWRSSICTNVAWNPPTAGDLGCCASRVEAGTRCQCFSAFWHVRRWYASEARSGVEVLLQMRRLSTEIPRFSTGIASLPRHQESHMESTTPPCTSYLVLGRTLKSKSASSRHLHCISKANSTFKLAYLTWPGARADDGRRLCGEDAGQGRLTPTWLALALAQTYRPPGS